MGIPALKVVYSKETPLVPGGRQTTDLPVSNPPEEPKTGSRRSIPGSIAFVPAAAGLILAGEVVKDLIGWKDGKNNI